MLIDLGELRGLGGHPDGRPWRTALTDPVDAGHIVTTVPLSEKSIATSCGAATRFEASGRHHHLFSPASGRSANTYEAVTVSAERATLADALSTALFVAPRSAAASSLSQLAGVQAFLWSADGSVSSVSSAG